MNALRLCCTRRLAPLGLGVLLWSLGSSAVAQQRQDFMFDVQREGLFAIADYFGSGAQLTLEHRVNMFGRANTLTSAASVLMSYPAGEVTVRSDLRILFLQLGVSLTYRSLWRNLSFEPGPDGAYCSGCDRESRRERDPLFGSGPDTDHFGIAEARATLLLPFNDHLILTSTAAVRHEGRRDRSYDWFFTHVHDGGVIGRWEATAFLVHRDWGGAGPYLQFMSLPQGDKHIGRFAYGFNAVTRLGLVKRDDLVFVTVLVRPGDNTYGQHAYYSPVRALIVYRMMLEL